MVVYVDDSDLWTEIMQSGGMRGKKGADDLDQTPGRSLSVSEMPHCTQSSLSEAALQALSSQRSRVARSVW
jgi:hypothetical protein